MEKSGFFEGIYLDRTDKDRKPKFVKVPPPTDTEIADVVHRVSRRVIRQRHKQRYFEGGARKSPWSDGTTEIQIAPVDLLEKLAPLTPKTQFDNFL